MNSVVKMNRIRGVTLMVMELRGILMAAGRPKVSLILLRIHAMIISTENIELR